MRPKTNRLLMVLIGAMLAGCASQTERSSSGGGAEQAQAPAPAPIPEPAYEPKGESVQIVDRPLEETPPPPPPPVAKAPEQPLPDFPITTYEVEPEEEVGDLGTQPDESGTEQYAEEDLAAKESVIGEPTEVGDEEEEEVADLGPQEDESGTEQYPEEDLAAKDSVVSEPTEVLDEEEEEVADLGPQEDESGTMESPEEDLVARESMVGEPTEVAEEPEEEVADLGPQPDESGTVTYPEQQLAAADKVIGEPTQYADEPVTAPAPVAAPAPERAPVPVAKAPVRVSFEAEPLFSFDKAIIRGDQRSKLDEFVASLKGTKYDSIDVFGHADRIGSTTYNSNLSQRRANAVKAYLVRQGIPAGKINAEGRGESEPVTGDNCSGQRGKALIACLEPDRRVDVSVTATKPAN
ncbi:MAG TPA: OmpA family protein [Burkholderiales bacterium]|nr:OmpA family protein [Burkholderiales bacterium]